MNQEMTDLKRKQLEVEFDLAVAELEGTPFGCLRAELVITRKAIAEMQKACKHDFAPVDFIQPDKIHCQQCGKRYWSLPYVNSDFQTACTG